LTQSSFDRQALADSGSDSGIEVDKRIADVLETRAAELGLTVSELVAELAPLTAPSGRGRRGDR
jgi:hypothetical protein